MFNINDNEIASVLLKRAYNERESPPPLPKPQDQLISPVALRTLRKKDLDDLGVSDSPLKNMETTNYGDCPFSRKAIEWKKENSITAGRNVAIVLFKHHLSQELDYTIDVTEGPPGAAHSELKAYDALPKEVKVNRENIVYVYTERKPCRHGSNCARKMKNSLGEKTQILYSAHHTPDKKRQRESEFGLQAKQHEEGIRVANPEYKKRLFETK